MLSVEETAKLLFYGYAIPSDKQPKWDIQPEHIKEVFRKKARKRIDGYFVVLNHPSGWKQIIRGDGTIHTYFPSTLKRYMHGCL